MRSAVLVEPGRIEMREGEAPTPGPGEVVVRVRSALTSGRDLRTWRQGQPAPLGQEFAGIVERVGEGVRGFRAGDEVMATASAPCGECFHCQRGTENLCEQRGRVPAGFAEMVAVPPAVVRQTMFRKPGHVSFTEAAFLEPLAAVLHALESVPIGPEDTVVVLGAGSVGLLFVAAAKQAGPHQVVVAGRGRERLALAEEMGADLAVDTESEPLVAAVQRATGGHGAEVVIECTGHPEMWRQSVEVASRASHVVLFGGCPGNQDVAFDTTRLHYDQITLVGAHGHTPRSVRRAFEMLSSGALRPARLVTGRGGLSDLPGLLEKLERGEGVKYEIVPEER